MKGKGGKKAFGVVKGVQRKGMTRSEEGAINSFDNFKARRVEGTRCMHEFSFYCTVLIFSLFQLCPTYFLSVNALLAQGSQLLWGLHRFQLLRKLVKITFSLT